MRLTEGDQLSTGPGRGATHRRQRTRTIPTTSPHQHEKHPTSLSPVNELGQLRPGDQVQVWHRGQIQCMGTVEEAAPALGVVWIREGRGRHPLPR